MTIRKSASSSPRSLTPQSSRESSPCEEKDYSTSSSNSSVMSSHYTSSRPLTVAIPNTLNAQGPFCAKRPCLSEILANNAPPPYTLSAFMAYLSQNHCLETLEFTMDASRYRKHYNKMTARNSSTAISAESEEVRYVKKLWQRLLEAYIAPNGAREVNIPSDVRDNLLAMDNSYLPPSPSSLDPAVNHVYSLMEESVLVPFLNSVNPTTAHPETGLNSSDENLYGYVQSHDAQRQRVRDRLSSPPSTTTASSFSFNPHSANRASAPSSFTQFARSLGNTTRFSSSTRDYSSNPSQSRALHLTTSASNSSTSNSDVVTDDSSFSGNSPTLDGTAELITPPTTPPMSDFCNYSPTASANHSPRNSRGEAWKKAVGKFGWRKKSSGEDDVEDVNMQNF